MCLIGSKIEKIFSIIILLLTITQIVLIILIRVKRPKKLSEFQVEDIFVPGLVSFDFIEDKTIPEHPNSNLGTTGKLILNCYFGNCTQEIFHEQYKIICDDDDDCYEANQSWTEYRKIIERSCSEQCYEFKKNNCSCDEPYNEEGICEEKFDDEYMEGKICYADNEIYFWKGKKIHNVNISNFSYLSDIILNDEECPEGTKNCGIIDGNGNELCIKSNLKCPLNYISENKLNNGFSSVLIGNKTFYYGNDDTKKRKIIAGLEADTDLLLNKDNDNENIIDNYTISGFLEDNQNLYKDINIGYDPYNINDIDSKGKSYLKILYNEQNVDLFSLRNNRNKQNLNHKMNINEINSIHKNTNITIILGSIGYGIFLLSFIYVLVVQIKEYSCFICISIFYLGLVLAPLIYGCNNISKVNKVENIDHNIKYSSFKKINILFIVIGFSLLLFLIINVIFVPFICCYREEKKEEEKENTNNNKDKDKDKDKNINTTIFNNPIGQIYNDSGLIAERENH